VLQQVVERIDQAAERACDRVRSPVADHLMYGLSSAADHSLLWHAIGAIRSARAGSLRPSLELSTALGIESALTNGPVKMLFRRVRPDRAVDGVTPERMLHGLRVPVTSSFPSGHAAAAFCAAVILRHETGTRAWYGLAAVVGATRVYTRMHHASDVIAGAAWGTLLGEALRVGLRR